MNNIVLYKCSKDINRLVTGSSTNKNQKIIIITEGSKLLKINKKISHGLIVHNGKEQENIIDIFKKINKTGYYALLFLSSGQAIKKHKSNTKKDIFYFSTPPSDDDLSNLIIILSQRQMLEGQIKDRDTIIKAYDNIGEFTRKELINAYETLQAQERVGELGRQELLDAKENLSAWESVSQLAKTELLNKMQEISALKNAMKYSRSRKQFMRELTSAWEHTMELTRKELLNAYKQAKKTPKKK